jgi:hypothetical protein
VGDELQTTVGCDVRVYAVLREYVADEEAYEFQSVDGVMRRKEDALLGVLIDDDKDGCESGRLR